MTIISENICLQGEGFYLRPWHANDTYPMYQAVKESHVSFGEWLSWSHEHYSLTDALNWTAWCMKGWGDDHFAFAIVGQSGKLFGSMDIRRSVKDPTKATVGYWLRTSAQGKGRTVKALELLKHFAFEQLGIEEIKLIISIKNTISQKVALKAGFLFKNTLENKIEIKGEKQDVNVYTFKKPFNKVLF